MTRTSSIAVFATLFLAACAGKPTIATGPDPADPSTPVPAAAYVPVTAGTVTYRPVEPKSWLGQNETVAPKPKTSE